MRRFTLYSKPGCHLCEVVKQVIEQTCAGDCFTLEIRDILGDPTDYERYKHDIPVVLLNGKEIARHRLSKERLEYAIADLDRL